MGVLFLSGQVWRDKTSRRNAEGNEEYRRKNFPVALEKYVEAQDVRKPRPEISYNLANTLYQQKKYSEALKEYEKAMTEKDQGLNQKTCFNRGNSYYQSGNYQGAAESFQRALELDPKDREAKHNLELALRRLQEKQQSPNPDPSTRDRQKQDKDDQQKKQDSKSGSSGQNQKEQAGRDKKEASKAETAQNQDRGSENPPRPQDVGKNMERNEALRILDAINDQEKKEQRKQALKVERARSSARDW